MVGVPRQCARVAVRDRVSRPAGELSWRCPFFFSSRRRHTRFDCDWSSDVCSSDLTYLRDQMPVWKTRHTGVEAMTVAVMGCVVNGPGESKHANLGISLPGTFEEPVADRKSTRLNSSHSQISYAVFCLKKKKEQHAL